MISLHRRVSRQQILSGVGLLLVLSFVAGVAEANPDPQMAETTTPHDADSDEYDFTTIFDASDRRALNAFFSQIGEIRDFDIQFIDTNNDGGGYYQLQVADAEGIHTFPLQEDGRYEGIRYEIDGTEIQSVILARQNESLRDVFDESPYVSSHNGDEQPPPATPDPTPIQTPRQSTSTPSQASTQTPSATHQSTPDEVTLQLTGQQTDITVAQDAILTFSGVNLIGNKPMKIQLIIQTPSGVSVESVANVETGSNQYLAVFTVDPGQSRNVRVSLDANQPGEHKVTGIAVYYFGDNETNTHRYSETVTLTVRPETTPTPSPSSTATVGTDGPGFTPLSAVLGVIILKIIAVLSRQE